LSLSVGVYTRHVAVRKFIPQRDIAEKPAMAAEALPIPGLPPLFFSGFSGGNLKSKTARL
jgi:hypothetical protein